MIKKFGRTYIITASLLLLFMAAFAYADENRWSTNGPYDARVLTIAIHPFDNQRLYIGTIENGIYQTTNGGTDWILMEDENDSLETTMRKIAIHPSGPDTIYAATVRGLFKSIDAAQSWFRLPVQFPMNEYFDVAVNPENPSMIFTGTWGPGYKSEDGGQTWRQLNVHAGSIDPITIDPINANIIYAGIGTYDLGHSIYKSIDYGETWYNIHNNIDSIGHPEAIAVDPVDPQIIYFARTDMNNIAGKCVYKSINGGDSWIDITPPGLVRNWVFDVLVSPLDHNTVFLCSHSNGLLRSQDGAQNWEEINQGRLNLKTKTIEIDTITGILYLGIYNDGIYRSLDNGDTWEKISHNISQAVCRDMALNWRNPDTLYVTTHNGLYMSANGAESWQHFDLTFPDADPLADYVAVDPYDASIVYLSYYPGWMFGQGALYRSLDGGNTWESFAEGLPSDTHFGKIAIADYGGGTRRLYMTSAVGLFYSENLGQSWLHCSADLPDNISHRALAVSPVNPDLVFVGTNTPGIYKTIDGGQSWIELGNVPFCDRIREIACDPVNPDIVYISLDYHIGIFKSSDGGHTWADINNNLPRHEYHYVSGICINPYNPENIFVNSNSYGVFISDDGGQTWESYSEGLRTAYYLGVTRIDPIDTNRVFLATWGHSVWSITRTPTSIDDDIALPMAFSVSNYPNPFNASTNIKFTLPNSSDVKIDIYDMLGRRVSTIVNEHLFAGYHSVMWNPVGLSSGIYFYKIETGEIELSQKMILLR